MEAGKLAFVPFPSIEVSHRDFTSGSRKSVFGSSRGIKTEIWKRKRNFFEEMDLWHKEKLLALTFTIPYLPRLKLFNLQSDNYSWDLVYQLSPPPPQTSLLDLKSPSGKKIWSQTHTNV